MKKITAFLYGIIAYCTFLVAFLYAVGFVGDFIVPKTINTGPDTGFVHALLIDAILLSVFALQHSIMARPAFKKWWTGIVGTTVERSTYVLLASLALLLLYWQWQPMPSIIWQAPEGPATTIVTAIYFLGWLIVFLSTLMISHFELFGLKQVFDNLASRQVQPLPFKANYFYTIIRHPIMLGFLIAFWATPVMTLGHLVFSITTTLYIFIAVKFFEEKDLRKLYGKQYEEYSKNVPMLIPFTKRPR